MRLFKKEILLNSRLVVFILFLFISITVVSTWFAGDAFYGGAEVGIVAYNPSRWLENSKNVWWSSSAPGQLIPHFIVGSTYYSVFSVIQLLGFSAQHMQQLFFTLLFFLMGLGVYLLAWDIFEEETKKYAILAGIFYNFNVYILVQVWHRFLYSTYILAAVLPFLILFWRRWIKKGNLFDLIIFLIINFISAYMYGNLASIITVWVGLMLLSLSEIIFPWKGRKYFFKIGLNFLTGFILWFLTNIWWIMPTFLIAPGLLATQHNIEDNLGTLIVISTQTMLPYLLQMVNPYYLFYQSELGQIYSNIFFKTVPWIISSLIFLGFIVALKTKEYAKYGLIYILILLLAKGAAAPFSYPYIYSFQTFFVLGVLRNPFEKLGILLPIFGALLFAIGIKKLIVYLELKWGKLSAQSAIIFIMLILVGFSWPMFGGKFFGTEKWPIKINIPSSYKEADRWLHTQKDDQGVILHLPYSGKDALTYKWDKGYHGVDHNEILFTSLPSLSRIVGIQRIDDTLKSLTYVFTPPYSDNKERILKSLQDFNVKYIVLHKDIDWEDKDTYPGENSLLNPMIIENTLNSLDFIEKKQQFEDLVIYKLLDQYYKPTIYTANTVQILYPGRSGIMEITSLIKADTITPVGKQDIGYLGENHLTIFPDLKLKYFEASRSSMLQQINNIITSPSTSQDVVRLFEIRNYLHSIGYIESEKIINDLILATEKILMLYRQSQANGMQPVNQEISGYQELYDNIFKTYSKDLTIAKTFSNDFTSILQLHLFILNELNQGQLVRLIEDEMVKLSLLPLYRREKSKEFIETEVKKDIFKFFVPSIGQYRLLIATSSRNLGIRVNNENIDSLNNLRLDKAEYEISYNSPESTMGKDPVLIKGEAIDSGKDNLLEFKKDNTVSFRGKINVEKPTFIFFQQAFHPGWTLTLTKSGVSSIVKDHFIGNLYGNAWWVKEAGEYNFNIEFTPQKNVGTGLTIAALSWILLLVGLFAQLYKNKSKRDL